MIRTATNRALLPAAATLGAALSCGALALTASSCKSTTEKSEFDRWDNQQHESCLPKTRLRTRDLKLWDRPTRTLEAYCEPIPELTEPYEVAVVCAGEHGDRRAHFTGDPRKLTGEGECRGLPLLPLWKLVQRAAATTEREEALNR